MYVNNTKIFKFKAKDNIRWYNFCLGSTSKDYTKDEQSEIFLHVRVLRYYPFADNLGGSCNALDHLSKKVCVPNKAEGLYLSVFNMITGINESETLAKHISCKCKCKFDGRKYNPNQKWIRIKM